MDVIIALVWADSHEKSLIGCYLYWRYMIMVPLSKLNSALICNGFTIAPSTDFRLAKPYRLLKLKDKIAK